MHTYEMATLTIPALEAAIAFILGGPLGAGVKFRHGSPPLGKQRIHKGQGWIRSCASEPAVPWEAAPPSPPRKDPVPLSSAGLAQGF